MVHGLRTNSRFSFLFFMSLLCMGGMIGVAADRHDHPTEGPHGGGLVELGEEEYHAEFIVNDKTKEVVFYILDKSAKMEHPVTAPELQLNLKRTGKPLQFKIPAAPLKKDPPGHSSRFLLKSDSLIKELHAHGAAAQMRVQIGQRSYQGRLDLAHHHDHDHPH